MAHTSPEAVPSRGVVEKRHEAERGRRRQREHIEVMTRRNARSEGVSGRDQNRDMGWNRIMLAP